MIKIIAITIAVIAISNIVFGKELQKVSGDCVCYCPKQSGWNQIPKNSGWNQNGESSFTSRFSSTKRFRVLVRVEIHESLFRSFLTY